MNGYKADKIMSPIYNRVQLFSGGGSRFGYYLGSYVALCEQGLKPDLILATCGGSLSALLVDIAPEPNQLKQLVQSRELYNVVRASQAVQSKPLEYTKPRYFHNAIKRWYLCKRPKNLLQVQEKETCDELLTELQQLAMFEINDENQWLDELINLKQSNESQSHQSSVEAKNSAPNIAIVASRLVANSGQSNLTPAKLQEVLFAPSKVINDAKQVSELSCPTHIYARNRLLPTIHMADITDFGIHQAVRASMADMYYLPPIHMKDLGWCLGGVIDLTPIELAYQLGTVVFAETKAGYDTKLAAPAIKRVFGFDANVRLQAVHDFLKDQQYSQNLSVFKDNSLAPQISNIHWLPFADNGKALSKMHTSKRIDLRRGNIALVHANYAGFVAQMQAQWEYGYKRTQQYLASL